MLNQSNPKMNSTHWMDNRYVILPAMSQVVDNSCNGINSHNKISAPELPNVYTPHTFTTEIMIPDMKGDKGLLPCTWCEINFNNKNALLVHIKEVHKSAKDHRCNECSKVFAQKSNLKAHMRLHTGEKPFNCTFCTKTFAQKSNLVNHLTVHTRNKPFQCQYCERAFSQKSNLKSHILTHTGERPYKCHLCTKQFVQKSNLVSHIRTHTSEKPHHCNLCNKSFSQRSNLISHLKLHTRIN